MLGAQVLKVGILTYFLGWGISQNYVKMEKIGPKGRCASLMPFDLEPTMQKNHDVLNRL